jgi:hypothetical protein
MDQAASTAYFSITKIFLRKLTFMVLNIPEGSTFHGFCLEKIKSIIIKIFIKEE